MSRNTNPKTIARPYAKAAFSYAKENKVVKAWEQLLATVAALIKSHDLSALLKSPSVSYDEVGEALLSALKGKADTHAMNFIALLIENKRLEVVGHILTAYKHLMYQDKKQIDARFVSASSVDAKTIDALKKALEDKLKQKVKIKTEIDPTLLGGGIIRIGDWVIDGSIRTKVTKLAHALVN